ncbi:MAG TPA: diphosphate--fructose-6-phosphate 1-phosphotransferase [Acidobacteriaceae bacterium]|nr:diphosphate--fructose-6-phosphate 1-phosphotransferase [Acidobacteriaceae bacterium]
MENLLVVQGGGPTPVLNATLSSILKEASQHRKIGRIFGAKSGVAGIARGEIISLDNLPYAELDQLRMTPGAALGSSRSKPSPTHLDLIVQHLRRLSVRHLLLIGGNGTMRGAEVIGQFCRDAGYDIQVMGIPKTVDNDIAVTDRCPGYASAARYVAQSTRDLGMDIHSLPQPVSIFETMGRNVGWLAAASAAAKLDVDDAPHLVYLPEQPFDTEEFLSDLDRIVARLGWAVVVVSEGLRNASGNLVYETLDPSQVDALKRPLPGGVGQFLAGIVANRLKIRCRTEKPGLLGRSSMLHVSLRDLEDAELVGRAGVRALLAGHSQEMVALRPLEAVGDTGYDLVPLSAVAGKDRPVPAAWLSSTATSVNDAFLEYIRPLIGDLLVYHSHFKPSLEPFGVS